MSTTHWANHTAIEIHTAVQRSTGSKSPAINEVFKLLTVKENRQDVQMPLKEATRARSPKMFATGSALALATSGSRKAAMVLKRREMKVDEQRVPVDE